MLLYTALDWGRTDVLMPFFVDRLEVNSHVYRNATRNAERTRSSLKQLDADCRIWKINFGVPLHRAHFFELGVDWDCRTLMSSVLLLASAAVEAHEMSGT